VQHGASPPTPRLDGRRRRSQPCPTGLSCYFGLYMAGELGPGGLGGDGSR